jgi:uncharacterized protein (DUF983 family)
LAEFERDHSVPAVSPFKAGLLGRCPRCGRGKLFEGFLSVAPECPHCGLDYTKVDTGDGPAVFIILIAGFLIVGLAMFVELSYQPPYWLHALIFLPLAILLPMGLLRPFKATLIALQYHNRAREGRQHHHENNEG